MEEQKPVEKRPDNALEFKDTEQQPEQSKNPGGYYVHEPPKPIEPVARPDTRPEAAPRIYAEYPQPINDDPIKETFRMVKAMLWSTAFISYLAIIIISFIIVLAMTPEIQSWITTPQPSADDPSVLENPIEYIFLIFPFPVLLFSISGGQFQAWHIFVLSILICAFSFSKYDLLKDWMSRRGQILLSLTTPEKAKSSLEGVAKLFMASTFFSTVYFIFLALGNVDMATPAFEEFSRPELIYGLFNASVFEELISRVLLIGVPLVIIANVKKWKKPWKTLLGGNLDINPMTMTLIAYSALFFALAHVGSWDLWKVPQVLVTGFVLGYAFVRYGLHASIMIHFSINLSSSMTEIWPGNMGVEAALGMAYFIWMIIGAYFFFDYIWRLLLKLGFISKPKPAVQASRVNYGPPPGAGIQQSPGSYQTPQQQPGANQSQYPNQPHYVQPPPQARQMQNPGGFICPNCGSTGASYSEGRLTCLRCGNIIGERKPAEPEQTENPEKEMFDF